MHAASHTKIENSIIRHAQNGFFSGQKAADCLKHEGCSCRIDNSGINELQQETSQKADIRGTA